MEEVKRIQLTLVSSGQHLVINPLVGKKNISKSNTLFWYVDRDFSQTKPGVKTKSKTIGVYDVVVGVNLSLREVFEKLPNSLNRKWLSQSQIVKVCKHFKKWLKSDDCTYFLIKTEEARAINLLDPWKNLMVVEVKLDHENDLSARLVSNMVLDSKFLTEKKLRFILPKPLK